MSVLPDRARVVIIGAGIVGNSMAYHLARLGWRDIVQVEKGPLPNPGGSTGHASNFIYLTDHSKEMTALTLDSVRQYQELGVFTQSGGIEVARTPERMEELKRRMASATSWGIDAELISPARVRELVPYVDESIILGGFYQPGVGVVDSLRAGTLMREAAQALGALTLSPLTETTGIDVVDGRIAAVRTTRGTIQTETVVIACGIWSPRIARMAGASIPLTPAIHQMISVGPVPMFADTRGEIEFPIVRDMDTNMYERQHGGDLEVGSYAHRPILMAPDDIPSIEASAMSPTELPFTSDDFDPQMEQALELVPAILGDERVGVRYAINGLLSLTPDGMPILGETPEVKGLWSTAAIWIKEAPGIARMVAEWMIHGTPEIDPHGSDIARFYDHHKTAAHVEARSAEGFNKTYGIVHPMEQWASNRNVRLSPVNVRQRELGAEFFEAAGWERPFWYGANERLLADYGERVMPRAAEWESRWWSPIINAEHLAMRERVAMVDLAAFAIFDVTGAGAMAYLQGLVVNQVDVPVGRVIYTPLLNAAGGIVADLTIIRLAHDRYRVVTGGGMGMRDKKWFADHLPADGSAQLHDLTSALYTVGVWGPAGAGPRPVDRPGRPVERRLPVRDGSDGRPRERPDPDVPDLLRRRARLGDLLPDGAGPPAVGHALGGRPGPRRRRGRDRRLRHDRPAGEGLSGARRRARARLRPRRGRDGPAEGQGRRLRGQGGLSRAAGEAAGRDPVHADRRRPDLGERGQALHARPRADPDGRREAARRRQGPPVVRDECRFGAVAGQAPPDELPAARGCRREATGSSSSTSASAIR